MAVFDFLVRDPIFFNTVIILASFYIIFKAADLIIDGIGDYAKKLGLSNYLIGIVVIALAASMPEVITSVMGFVSGEEGVGIGAILGTNMVHAVLVVGVLLVIGKKMEVEFKLLEKSKLVLWAFLMLPFVLMFDGLLSRSDGIILVSVFVFYLVMLWKKEGTFGKIKKNVKLKTVWRDVFIFLGSLAALMLAGRWLVFGAVNIANTIGVSPFFISLTVIAIGSTIPDFMVGLRSVVKGVSEIGIGDILGSVVIELLLFFGIVAIISPIKIPVAGVLSTMIFLMCGLTMLLFFLRKKVLGWKHGALMLAVYVAFLVVEIIKAV